jgi:hypothetical protein
MPVPAALACELFAHVVPDLFAVDQDTVEVEDDRCDFSLTGLSVSHFPILGPDRDMLRTNGRAAPEQTKQMFVLR